MNVFGRARRNLGRWYPAGYEYKWELGLAAGLAGIGFCGSLRFFEELYREMQRLYCHVEGERSLRKGVIAASFTGLTDWYWFPWLPALVFLAAMPLYHCFYYHRDTKSIYVMRRLPHRGILFKSCVQGPLLAAGAVLGVAALLYLLYFGIYLLSVPGTMRRFA